MSGRRPPIVDHLVGEHVGPGPRGRGRLGRGRRGRRGGRDLVQAVLFVLLGQGVAEPLAGDHVHQHRPAVLGRLAQRVLHHRLVVAVDRADVLDAEVLEQHLRLEEVLEALLGPVQRAEQRVADDRGGRHRGLDQVEDLLVALVDADRRQVAGEPADRRLVGAAVVVDNDDQPRVAGDGDVVQRLPGHPAGQRAVADHRDHGPVVLAPQPVRLGHPVGVGQRRGGVRVLHQVVLGLGPARVAGQAAGLPQRVELGSGGRSAACARRTGGRCRRSACPWASRTPGAWPASAPPHRGSGRGDRWSSSPTPPGHLGSRWPGWQAAPG